MVKGRREGRTEPNGCDGCRASPRQVEPHSWKAVCYESSLHGLGRGSWKRAEFERVGKSQSVTTFEKRSSESIAEATRWLPTSSKKRTTSTAEAAKVESSGHKMPDEQEFRQRLRNLAVSAMRVLIEEVMREELEMCLGAVWGESTPSRKGYRNGSYTRDLVTKTGCIEDLSVPRDRAGQFHTQVFERYSRYEPEVAEALTEMFGSGTSTHKGGKVAEKLP